MAKSRTLHGSETTYPSHTTRTRGGKASRALALVAPDALAAAIERYHELAHTPELREARDLEAFAAAALALVATAERAIGELRATSRATAEPAVQRM